MEFSRRDALKLIAASGSLGASSANAAEFTESHGLSTFLKRPEAERCACKSRAQWAIRILKRSTR
jgi:hypothetical protein